MKVYLFKKLRVRCLKVNQPKKTQKDSVKVSWVEKPRGGDTNEG